MKRNKSKKYLFNKYKKLTEELTNPKRFKNDGFVLVQYKLYNEIKGLGLKRDLWKYNEWWDFYNNKHRLVIKIINTEYDIENSNVKIMQHYGWTTFFIKFDDIKSGLGIPGLIKKIKLHFNKGKFIEKRAIELNSNLPKSEDWFKSKLMKEPFFDQMGFEFNKPMFDRYIIDVFSKKYRLCIEVDGSIHDKKEQQIKDDQKDNVTRIKGFHIIRVSAFNEESYDIAIKLIKHIIKNKKSRNFRLEIQEDINTKLEEIEKSGKLPF